MVLMGAVTPTTTLVTFRRSCKLSDIVTGLSLRTNRHSSCLVRFEVFTAKRRLVPEDGILQQLPCWTNLYN
jgi:hypothetical protein